MPRGWRSLFQNKNYYSTVLAIWPNPLVHDFCLIIEMDHTGDVSTCTHNALGKSFRKQPLQQHGSTCQPSFCKNLTGTAPRQAERLCCVELELFSLSPFTQRFSLTQNYSLFNICLHFKTSGTTNPITGNEDNSALWKKFIRLNKNMGKLYARKVKLPINFQAFIMPQKTLLTPRS